MKSTLCGRRPPRRPAVLAISGLLGLASLAAACGGSTKTGSAATSTTTGSGSGALAAARAKFTSCLESHGVPASEATRPFFGRRAGTGSTSSSPTSTPPTTTAAYAAAFAACRRDLPTGLGRGGFQNTTAGRAYLQCLQLHGVTVPSTPPTSSAGGSGPGGGFGSIADNPNFQQARAACAALAPSRTGASSTTSAAGA